MAILLLLFRLLDPERPRILVGQQIQQAVRMLPHVANPLMQVAQQRLAIDEKLYATVLAGLTK